MPPPNDDWHATLTALAARNGAVQITLPPASGHEVGHSCKTRLLAVADDGTFIIERPMGAGMSRQLTETAEVEVLAVREPQRWRGRCPVLGGLRFELNASQRVPAVKLGPPTEVVSAQRRRFFRVDTSAKQLPVVLLEPARAPLPTGGRETGAGDGVSVIVDTNPPPGPVAPLETRLVNISGGGMGLTVPTLTAETSERLRGGRYRYTLRLPTFAVPVVVHARLVHLEEMQDGSLYLGLAFEFRHERERHRIQDQIVRFAADVQRQQLRRQRGA